MRGGPTGLLREKSCSTLKADHLSYQAAMRDLRFGAMSGGEDGDEGAHDGGGGWWGKEREVRCVNWRSASGWTRTKR